MVENKKKKKKINKKIIKIIKKNKNEFGI